MVDQNTVLVTVEIATGKVVSVIPGYHPQWPTDAKDLSIEELNEKVSPNWAQIGTSLPRLQDDLYLTVSYTLK